VALKVEGDVGIAALCSQCALLTLHCLSRLTGVRRGVAAMTSAKAHSFLAGAIVVAGLGSDTQARRPS